MKMLHLLQGQRDGVLIDFSNNNVTPVEAVTSGIDWIYQAPEDCEVRYTTRNKKIITLKAKKGDVIVKFYERKYIKNPIVVVDSKKFIENITGVMAEINEASAPCRDCECGCDCCC